MAKKELPNDDLSEESNMNDEESNEPTDTSQDEPDVSAAGPKSSVKAASTPRPKKRKKRKQTKPLDEMKPAKRVEKEEKKSSSRIWIIGIILLVVAAALAVFIWKLSLHAGPVQATLTKGETKLFTIGGTNYEITPTSISDQKKVEFTVNGKPIKELGVGESEILSNGTMIIVNNVVNQVTVQITISAGPSNGQWSGNPVVITEYSDFQCPFCKRAEDTMIKLKELYGPKIQIDYKHYPLPFHVNAEISAEASECARDQGKFQEYHDLLFKMSQPDGTNLARADHLKYAQQLGLDVAKFTQCLDSGSKKTIVAAQQAEGQAKGVSGTPAFFIGSDFISGAQPIEVFITSIDKALGTDSGNLAKLNANEPKVELIVVNDQACGASCDPTKIVQVTKQLFPLETVRNVDISSDEGKQLVTKYQLEKVPSFIFTSNIQDATQYKSNPQLQQAFAPVADKYKIVDQATGAARFIDPAKQAEYEAALAAAKKQALEKLGITDGQTKPQVDFFVMAFCPYGNQAEDGLNGAYKILGDKVIWNPRYVVYSNYQGGGPTYCMDENSSYCSMHGVQEMHEDIRELCVKNEYGQDVSMSFIIAINNACTAQNADTCWQDVAKKLNISTNDVETCAANQGTSLAQGQLDLDNLLSVQGSPTIFINGQEYSGDRSAQGFLSAICATFKDRPAECSQVPAPSNTPTAPAGGCGG